MAQRAATDKHRPLCPWCGKRPCQLRGYDEYGEPSYRSLCATCRRKDRVARSLPAYQGKKGKPGVPRCPRCAHPFQVCPACGEVLDPKPTGDRWLDLVQRCPLRPIRHDASWSAAREVVRALVRHPRLDDVEARYLQVLAGVVARYERKHFPRQVATDRAVLAFLVEAKGRPLATVARDTAIAEATLAQVLRGSRTLTRAQVAKLAAWFHVGEAAFPPRTGGGTRARWAGPAGARPGRRLAANGRVRSGQ